MRSWSERANDDAPSTWRTGQLVIRGTRVLVRTLLGYLAHGKPVDAILRDFLTVSAADVRAVIADSGS